MTEWTSASTRLSFDVYRAHLRTESDRFGETLDALLDSPAVSRQVPTCPDWTAEDLLWHLTEVQHFWTEVMLHRPAHPADFYADPERPTTYAEVMAAYADQSARLSAALENLDPTTPAWSWSDEQTTGFTMRRQAHEALIHRVDAELTAKVSVTTCDPALAADCVDELLGIFHAGMPEGCTYEPDGQTMRIELSDTGHLLWVTLGRVVGTNAEGTAIDEPGLRLTSDPGTTPDAVITGTAQDLALWLWQRGPREPIAFGGSAAALANFEHQVGQPLD